MRAVVNILRVLVGLLFIFSGLIKANDPLGLAYKMDEYFAVWGWHWASAYSLYLSIGMNVLEIVAGVALLVGWAPKFITRLLLLLIIFFTFLTGYAVITGNIKTCGCFGDCVPLEAWQSFVKDILLLAAILVLVYYHRLINPLLNQRAMLFMVLFSSGLVFWGQLHALKNLPQVDSLPYKAGNNLLQQMQPPAGSIHDSTTIVFVYKKDGKELSFDANSFPADFDEATYEFIKREEKLVRKGNAEAAIKDFALYSASGADTTKALLQQDKNMMWVFMRNFTAEKASSMKDDFDKLFTAAKRRNAELYLVTNQPEAAQRYFNQQNNYALPVLTCDGTVMKTMLRSDIGVLAMKGAVVQRKWSEANFNDASVWLVFSWF